MNTEAVKMDTYSLGRSSTLTNTFREGDRIIICSGASYCYFAISILLFSVGTVITILALDDTDGLFGRSTHMWLVGPLFISSGLMVAIKTLIYLRKETMVMYLTRERTLVRELDYRNVSVTRSCNNLTRPPSYETVVGQQQQLLNSTGDEQPPVSVVENPPPSYEEAIRLIAARRLESS